MKNPFSRLFGLGEKESEFDYKTKCHEEKLEKVNEEIQKFRY